ncbi:hypothetical protein EK904_010936 [Melospiza melodia maxima]|nr:hypothetical protein EK904_010936 [Melospiza melodia maxima]
MEQLVKLLLWQILLQQIPADASNPSSSVVVSVLNISAALGSQAVLPCKSHRMVWTQDRLNDRQRVVHWDLLSSYFGDGRMERLCDMYSAGDQRVYSSYNQGRILMPENAFADGNFSLVIKGVAESDAGTYSCNLHHHYCHLYETVKVQLVIAKRDPNVVRGHNVINVIIPEGRMHFFQQLGYVLATLLLFLVLLIIVALVTRRRRHRGYEYNVKKYGEKDVNLKEFTVDTTDLTPHKSEDIRLDYKNNILKEKAEQARSCPAKNIDLDKGRNIVNEDAPKLLAGPEASIHDR